MGLSTATFLPPLRLFSSQGLVGIGSPNADFFDVNANSLAGYGLDTSIGPVGGSTATNFNFPFTTSSGDISFSRINQTGSFQATLSPAAAPEPGTLPLLGMGIVSGLGTVGTLRRRKAKAQKVA